MIEIFVNDGEYVLSNVVYDLGVEIKGKVQGILTGMMNYAEINLENKTERVL